VEIGIIGAGWWAARAYLPLLAADDRVTAISVCRPDRAGLDVLANAYPDAHPFTDAEEMLARRPLAGVIVSSPHPLHAEHALMGLVRGIPVLVEKPMATTPADARRVATAAEGGTVLVAYGWNFGPVALAARRLVAEGRIGELVHGTCQMATSTRELFAGEDHPTTAEHLFRPPKSTWADPENAGGYGWGQLTHALGLLFLLTDRAPAGAFARMRLSEAGVDHSVAAVIGMSNGATVAVSGTALLPRGRRRQIDIRLFGTEGALLLDVERDRLEVSRFDGATHVEALAQGAGDYGVAGLIDTFLEICAGRPAVNPADARIGLRAVEAVDAIHRSARSGRFEAVWRPRGPKRRQRA